MGHSIQKKVHRSSLEYHSEDECDTFAAMSPMEQLLFSSAVCHLFYPIETHSVVTCHSNPLPFLSRFVLAKWEYHPILTWNQLSKSFPWGVFMLQGAGLAIADAFKVAVRHLTFESSCRRYCYCRYRICLVRSLLFFSSSSELLKRSSFSL